MSQARPPPHNCAGWSMCYVKLCMSTGSHLSVKRCLAVGSGWRSGLRLEARAALAPFAEVGVVRTSSRRWASSVGRRCEAAVLFPFTTAA
jgi:hypothetical protein